ncbi:MAG: M42 family metallopeptidase [Chitinophagales bacterium]|jgi:endoglucanase|nr:M42 family metallopeptidase [Chitinophagales bacterium]
MAKATKKTSANTLDMKLLALISETPGVSGFEQKIREVILKEATPYSDEISVDPMGNVVCLIKGKDSSQKVMVPAHMDEIGFIVTHIDTNGFLRFHTLGGFDPKTLTAQRVLIHTKQKTLIGVMGSKPIHVMTPEERTKVPQITDYFIDLGMRAEEVHKYVEVGNPITRERSLIEMGDCVNGKSLDNRISVYILLEAMRQLKGKKLPFDFYAVFSVQEEVGLRGANTAAHYLDPDFGICLDTTIAYDVPGSSEHNKITALGKGTAIKIMDTSIISDYRMVEYMKQICKDQKITYQTEILTGGATDAAAMQKMAKNGAIVGAISIPTRHIHQVVEMSHKEDILGSIELLKHCLLNLDQFDWAFK